MNESNRSTGPRTFSDKDIYKMDFETDKDCFDIP